MLLKILGLTKQSKPREVEETALAQAIDGNSNVCVREKKINIFVSHFFSKAATTLLKSCHLSQKDWDF